MTDTVSKPGARFGKGEIVAIAALVAGALAMGISPTFVRIAEVGPFTSAFYRVFLALPALWLWARLEARGAAVPAHPDPGWTLPMLLAGAFFFGDLFFWHLAIFRTTIANATLLATLAPVWVALFSGLFIGETVTRTTVAGLALCIAGASLLIGSSWGIAPERLVGDLYGLATSLFFGFYFLAVRVARRTAMSGLIVLRSTIVTAVLLGIVAGVMENAWFPSSISGALALLALALVSHTGGQGLLTYALGTLSAAFSSLVIFMEALFAAFFGWAFFHESLQPLQYAGGIAILIGIWIARPR